MFVELAEFLYSQIAEVANARILRIPGNDRMAYIDQGGEVIEVEIPPPDRKSAVASIDDLCAAAKAYGKDGQISFWITTNSVVLVLDDQDRREHVTMNLRKTAAYQKVLWLAQNPALTQAELISLLRMDLRDLTGRNELLTKIRTLKFSLHTEGISDLSQGRESLGKKIENQVTGAGDLPEDLRIHTPLFDNPGERDEGFTIEMLFEVMPTETKQFRIKPVPASLEDATDAALQGMRTAIEEQLEGVRVFFGTP